MPKQQVATANNFHLPFVTCSSFLFSSSPNVIPCWKCQQNKVNCAHWTYFKAFRFASASLFHYIECHELWVSRSQGNDRKPTFLFWSFSIRILSSWILNLIKSVNSVGKWNFVECGRRIYDYFYLLRKTVGEIHLIQYRKRALFNV